MNPMITIYLNALRRALPLLVLASVILAVSTYLISRSLGPSYEVHYSYLVSLKSRDTVPDYRFDGYYALQATDLFTATLAQWTTTPEVITEAFKEAGIETKSMDAKSLRRIVRAEKAAPQLVAVTVTGMKKEETEKLAEGLKAVMKKNVDHYQDQGIPAVQFAVVATTSWTGVNELQTGALALVALVATLFVGVNVVLLATSVKYWP